MQSELVLKCCCSFNLQASSPFGEVARSHMRAAQKRRRDGELACVLLFFVGQY